MRRLTLATIATFIALPTPAAFAKDDDDKHVATAKTHFARGRTFFEAERFIDALAEFRAGYSLVPRPGFLILIANTERKLGARADARLHYEKFLRESPTGDNRQLAERALAEMEAEEARAASDPTESLMARALVAEKEPAPEEPAPEEPPSAEPLPAEPPPARAPQARDSTDDEEPPDLPASSIVATTSQTPRRDIGAPKSRSGRSFWVWTVIGVAVLGAAAGIYLTVSGSGRADYEKSGSWGAIRQ